jgi:hypothetical protein
VNAAARAVTSQAEHDATQVLIAALNNLSAIQVENAVWNASQAGHLTAGSTGESLNNAGAVTSPAAIADAVWDETLSGHLLPGSTGEALGKAKSGGAGQIIVKQATTGNIEAELKTKNEILGVVNDD